MANLNDVKKMAQALEEFKRLRGMSPKQKSDAMKELNIGFDKETGKAIMPDVESGVFQQDVNKIMAENAHMVSLEQSAKDKGWKSFPDHWELPDGKKVSKKDASAAFLKKYGKETQGVDPQSVTDAIVSSAKKSGQSFAEIGKPGATQMGDFKNLMSGVGEALAIPQRAAFQAIGKQMGLRPDEDGLYSGKELVNPVLKQIAVGSPEDKERFAENVSPIVGAGVDVVADPLNFIPGPGAVSKLNKAKKVLGTEKALPILEKAKNIPMDDSEKIMEAIRDTRKYLGDNWKNSNIDKTKDLNYIDKQNLNSIYKHTSAQPDTTHIENLKKLDELERFGLLPETQKFETPNTIYRYGDRVYPVDHPKFKEIADKNVEKNLRDSENRVKRLMKANPEFARLNEGYLQELNVDDLIKDYRSGKLDKETPNIARSWQDTENVALLNKHKNAGNIDLPDIDSGYGIDEIMGVTDSGNPAIYNPDYVKVNRFKKLFEN